MGTSQHTAVEQDTPRIDFYILDTSEPDARLRCACRLAEKAYKLEHAVHLHAGSGAQARMLDELLWSFRDRSFVPHELCSNAGPATAPVTIGHGSRLPSGTDVLISLTDAIPPFFDQFNRVIEIVDGVDQHRQSGRERYRVYKDNGCRPQTHTIA